MFGVLMRRSSPRKALRAVVWYRPCRSRKLSSDGFARQPESVDCRRTQFGRSRLSTLIAMCGRLRACLKYVDHSYAVILRTALRSLMRWLRCSYLATTLVVVRSGSA